VLANRGRFLALWAVFRSGPPDPRRVLLHGKEHLDAVHGRGAILLTFHLGPGLTGRVLRDCGYLTRGTGEPSDLVRPTIPTRSQEFPRPVQWQRDDVASRGVGLLRARGHLLAGALLRITADGGAGQAAFEVPLPGLAFTVRTGWWALRRQTGVSALPPLVRREGRRFVVDIHPPLPDPAEDPEQDKARCREVLTELLGDYVRRFPDQCVSLALSSSYGHALR
jgi:lauroyl/myristoyl acyltransferase